MRTFIIIGLIWTVCAFAASLILGRMIQFGRGREDACETMPEGEVEDRDRTVNVQESAVR